MNTEQTNSGSRKKVVSLVNPLRLLARSGFEIHTDDSVQVKKKKKKTGVGSLASHRYLLPTLVVRETQCTRQL